MREKKSQNHARRPITPRPNAALGVQALVALDNQLKQASTRDARGELELLAGTCGRMLRAVRGRRGEAQRRDGKRTQ